MINAVAATVLATATIALSMTLAAQQPAERARAPQPGIDWPAFRGIDASGLAEGRPAPTTFTPTSAAWRTKISGLGNSSPIVWGDLLCVTTAISARDNAFKPGLYGDIEPVNDSSPHEWKVMCLDKRSGKTRWEQTVHKGVPAVKRHPKGTQANATLATDGTHLAAFFGSEGLHVYDLAGNKLWSKNFGLLDSGFFAAPEAQWGFASSPIIHDGKVIVQADVQKGSFLAAFEVATGKEIWRVARNDVPTWGTPAVVDAGEGRKQVVVNGWKHTGGYDLATGRELWKLTGGGDIPTPTPIAGHGLVFITSAHGDESPVYAIRTTATGDISLKRDETSNAHVAWTAPRAGSYMSTPLLYGDYLYVVRWNGILVVFEASSGKRVYQQRLGSGATAFTASPVASGGHIYFATEDGEVYVVKAGPTYELVATNHLDAAMLASPAISEGQLFIRTKDELLAFGN
jgi:hypothetical protein